MVVLSVFPHTDKCGEETRGCPGQPLRGEDTHAHGCESVRSPSVYCDIMGSSQCTKFWGQRLILSSKLSTTSKILKYLPWKLSINVNKWLTMVLSICQSGLKLKLAHSFRGIVWKMWNAKNFAPFNVLPAQWPISLSITPPSHSQHQFPQFWVCNSREFPMTTGREDWGTSLRGVQQGVHDSTLSKMRMINTGREGGTTSSSIWDTAQNTSLNQKAEEWDGLKKSEKICSVSPPWHL